MTTCQSDAGPPIEAEYDLEPIGLVALLTRRRSAAGFWQENKRLDRVMRDKRRHAAWRKRVRFRDDNKSWDRVSDWVRTDRDCRLMVEALVRVARPGDDLVMIGTVVLEERIFDVGLERTKWKFSRCSITDGEREAILKGV